MSHIKRAKVAEEAKKEAENPLKGKHLGISIRNTFSNLAQFFSVLNNSFEYLIMILFSSIVQ